MREEIAAASGAPLSDDDRVSPADMLCYVLYVGHDRSSRGREGYAPGLGGAKQPIAAPNQPGLLVASVMLFPFRIGL
jgi:hypothetical protein